MITSCYAKKTNKWIQDKASCKFIGTGIVSTSPEDNNYTCFRKLILIFCELQIKGELY